LNRLSISPRNVAVTIKFGRRKVEAVRHVTERLLTLHHNEREHKRVKQAWYRASIFEDLETLRLGVWHRTPAREGEERQVFIVCVEELKWRAYIGVGACHEGRDVGTYVADATFALCDGVLSAVKREDTGSATKPTHQDRIKP
jgi:hypothetical protein